MNKIRFKNSYQFKVLFLLTLLSSCSKDDSLPDKGKSKLANIVVFEVEEQNGVSSFGNGTVKLHVIKETDLTKIVPVFRISENAKAFVGSVEQISGVTENDFSEPLTYTVIAEDGNSKNWIVTIEEAEFSITVSTFVNSFPGNDELSIDSDGNIYVNSNGSNGLLDGKTVHKVSPSGSVSLFATDLPLWPVGSLIDDGSLYITGWQDGIITKINIEDGTKQVVLTGIKGAGSLELDILGNVYVVEYLTNSVLKKSASGGQSVYATGGTILNPAGIAIDPRNSKMYVSNFTNGTINIITGGKGSEFVTLPVSGVGPIKIFDDFIYATCPMDNVIYRIEISTKKVAVFAGNGMLGHTNGNLKNASFDTPTGIGSLDGKTFFVSESFSGGGRLRKIVIED